MNNLGQQRTPLKHSARSSLPRTNSEVYLCEIRLVRVGKHPARLHITHLWVIY